LGGVGVVVEEVTVASEVLGGVTVVKVLGEIIVAKGFMKNRVLHI
jgi:hypothetical protein